MTNERDRERIRTALAGLFVDDEVDYLAIARDLGGYRTELVERIFFDEVAPACHWNLWAPVPPVWSGFDSDWLAREIERRRAARCGSAMQRLRHRLLVAWLRRLFGQEWARLAAELDRHGVADRDSGPSR